MSRSGVFNVDVGIWPKSDFTEYIMYGDKEYSVKTYHRQRVVRIPKTNVAMPDYLKWRAKGQILAEGKELMLVLISAL